MDLAYDLQDQFAWGYIANAGFRKGLILGALKHGFAQGEEINYDQEMAELKRQHQQQLQDLFEMFNGMHKDVSGNVVEEIIAEAKSSGDTKFSALI